MEKKHFDAIAAVIADCMNRAGDSAEKEGTARVGNLLAALFHSYDSAYDEVRFRSLAGLPPRQRVTPSDR